MQIYWIIVLFFLHVKGDITLSTENNFANSAHCEVTREEDDEYCGAICYPIVKPLLRYAEICQGKDQTIYDLKDQIHEKDVSIAELKGQLKLAKSLNMQASKQVEHLKEQSDAKIKSLEEQLKHSANEILKMGKEMKDEISKIGMQIQAKGTEMQSKDTSLRELGDQVKFLTQSWKGSCLPFTNSTDIHTIRLNGIGPSFDVPCNSSVAGSGWTVIQRRVNGNVDFNRNWTDYKHGFGDLRADFFLGLDKIHQMTQNQPHELYIQLGKVNGSTGYAHFDDFKIGSEEEAYELKSLGNYSGTAGDSLTVYHLNMKFSTLDRDNDIHKTVHCSSDNGGGWWFHECGVSNLNGNYYKEGKRNTKRNYGILWIDWHNFDWEMSLTYTQMMIRPKTL